MKKKIKEWWDYMKNNPTAWMPIIVVLMMFGFLCLIYSLTN